METNTGVTPTNRFAPITIDVKEEENKPIPYSHGFSGEEVERITLAKAILDKKISCGESTTLEEFKSIIVPWLRINRTTAFNLNPEKPKKEKVVRIPKAKVPKEPKIKKLTKKFIKEEMSRLVFKQAMKEELTPDEITFIETHTQDI